jgi:Tol biopolymer transport system component
VEHRKTGAVLGRWRAPVGLVGVALLALLIAPLRTDGSCNQIPGVTNTFRGAQGTLDRPFASPGDVVELRTSPFCDAAATFPDSGAATIVSVIFTPPAGPRSIVVLAADCASLSAQVAACGQRTDVAHVVCVQTSQTQVLDERRLHFVFPDTDALLDATNDDRTLAGPATIAVTAANAPLPCDLASTPCAGHAGLLGCVDTLFTIDGTCGTTPDATFSHFTALPPPNDYQAMCIDPSPPCTGRAGELHFTIDAAGNILLPMDWSGILLGQQVPVARLLRGGSSIAAFPDSTQPIDVPNAAFLHSYSPEGGMLPPLFEPQTDPTTPSSLTLFGSADAPRTVLVVTRRSPQLTQCAGGTRVGLPCIEDGDCPASSCGPATCLRGDSSADICHSDGDCSGGACGRGLFDFSSRLDANIGPVVVPRFGGGVCQDSGVPCSSDASCGNSRCVSYRLTAQDPVAIDGLQQTQSLLISVVPEAIVGKDLNGDGDQTDEVLLLADRQTGVQRPIGTLGAPGRAATRIHEAPFSYPAAAADGDLVAFLEAEPLQGYEDANGDGDSFDTILRVFRRTDTGAVELTAGRNLAVDAAPMVNGRSLVIANGLVYFRTSEAANARHLITRVSVASDGSQANGRSVHTSISADGRHVAFESDATNLASSSDALAPGSVTTYVHDVDTRTTLQLQLTPEVEPGTYTPSLPALNPAVSKDGRYVAVSAPDPNGREQVWVVDRDTDGNGIYDEPDGISTHAISVEERSTNLGDGDSVFPALTPDARYVSFNSTAQYLIAGNVNDVANTYRVARTNHPDNIFDEPGTRTVTSATSGVNSNYRGNASSVLQPAPISDDGRFIAYANFSRNILADDTNDFCLNFFPDEQTSSNCVDVYLWDFFNQFSPQRVSLSTAGEQGNQGSLTPAMSRDGNYVAFQSFATNLVPGDTNGVTDVFVRTFTDPFHFLRVPDSWTLNFRGRQLRTTSRVSVSSSGEQANGSCFDRTLAMSADGRYIAFASSASNLVPGDTNDVCDNNLDGVANENCYDIFVHDQVTGFTRRANVAADGSEGNGRSAAPAMSADGQTIVFQSRASNLVPGDTNIECAPSPDGGPYENCSDVFIVRPDPASVGVADLNGDGDIEDTVLQVFDVSSGGVTTVAPAEQVAVAGDIAAFLTPDPNGPNAKVPAGPNGGDGDAVDLHLYLSRRGGPPQDLQRTARAIALSEEWLAALVPEPDEPGGDLNGDGDTLDTILELHRIGDPPGAWVNTKQEADGVQVHGSIVAFTTPELTYDSSPKLDLTGYGFGDDDRVMQLYDADAQAVIPLRDDSGFYWSVVDYVLGDNLLAFRSREQARPRDHCDLNGDGDCTDSVMFIYDLRDHRLINTGQAAIACPLETCNPRVPYKVLNDTVQFLTLEAEQGQDLNDDGDQNDLVLQTFNVRVAATPALRYARTRRAANAAGPLAGALTTIGAVSTGICTNSGAACVRAEDCGTGGQCFVPPGGCVRDLGTVCNPTAPTNECGDNGFCLPSRTHPGNGTCQIKEGTCASDADCVAPAQCNDTGQAIQRLVSPLAAGSSGGAQVFVAAGHTNGLMVATAADADGDEIADPFDNCPTVANVDQADRNGNGVGDACEAAAATATQLPSPPVSATPTTNPTVTRTQTPTASATTAPSPSTTRAASPTAQPTLAPPPSDGGGCAVAPRNAQGGWGVLAMPLLALAMVRRQRSSTPRAEKVEALRDTTKKRMPFRLRCVWCAAFLLTTPAVGRGATINCAGDCNADGFVTVDELLTGVGIALGGERLASCPSLDTNGAGAVAVNDLLTAVNNALDGCPADVNDATVATVLVTTQALADFSSEFLLALSSANNFSGGGAAALDGTMGGAADAVSTCPLGGTEQRSCDDLDDGVASIPIRVDNCTYETAGSIVRISGVITLQGAGFCPGVFVPSNVRLDFAVSTITEDMQGNVLRSTRFDLKGFIQELTFGLSACAVKSITLSVDGTVQLDTPAGMVTTLTLHDSHAMVSFAVLGNTCEPAVAHMTFNGDAHVTDVTRSPPLDLASTFSNVTVTLSPILNTGVDFSGAIGADCFGGTADVMTRSSIMRGATGPCPASGVLDISRRGPHTTARYTPEGAVQIDTGADGTVDQTLPSCVVSVPCAD